MSPSKLEISLGQKANDQVAAFISLKRRGIPYYYGAMSFMLMLLALAAFSYTASANSQSLGITLFLVAIFWSILSYLHWQALIALYRRNLKLLDRLHADYGEQLPWVKEATLIAAIREIQVQEARGLITPS